MMGEMSRINFRPAHHPERICFEKLGAILGLVDDKIRKGGILWKGCQTPDEALEKCFQSGYMTSESLRKKIEAFGKSEWSELDRKEQLKIVNHAYLFGSMADVSIALGHVSDAFGDTLEEKRTYLIENADNPVFAMALGPNRNRAHGHLKILGEKKVPDLFAAANNGVLIVDESEIERPADKVIHKEITGAEAVIKDAVLTCAAAKPFDFIRKCALGTIKAWEANVDVDEAVEEMHAKLVSRYGKKSKSRDNRFDWNDEISDFSTSEPYFNYHPREMGVIGWFAARIRNAMEETFGPVVQDRQRLVSFDALAAKRIDLDNDGKLVRQGLTTSDASSMEDIEEAESLTEEVGLQDLEQLEEMLDADVESLEGEPEVDAPKTRRKRNIEIEEDLDENPLERFDRDQERYKQILKLEEGDRMLETIESPDRGDLQWLKMVFPEMEVPEEVNRSPATRAEFVRFATLELVTRCGGIDDEKEIWDDMSREWNPEQESALHRYPDLVEYVESNLEKVRGTVPLLLNREEREKIRHSQERSYLAALMSQYRPDLVFLLDATGAKEAPYPGSPSKTAQAVRELGEKLINETTDFEGIERVKEKFESFDPAKSLFTEEFPELTQHVEKKLEPISIESARVELATGMQLDLFGELSTEEAREQIGAAKETIAMAMAAVSPAVPKEQMSESQRLRFHVENLDDPSRPDYLYLCESLKAEPKDLHGQELAVAMKEMAERHIKMLREEGVLPGEVAKEIERGIVLWNPQKSSYFQSIHDGVERGFELLDPKRAADIVEKLDLQDSSDRTVSPEEKAEEDKWLKKVIRMHQESLHEEQELSQEHFNLRGNSQKSKDALLKQIEETNALNKGAIGIDLA